MAPQDFTYAEVGATQTGSLPDGYSHLNVRTHLGSGPGVLRAAAEALLDFRMHRAIPVQIKASVGRVETGAFVEVGMGVGRLRLTAPCRVVWVEEGRRRSGWAYGTLPGHPEHGEEAFVVEMDDAEEVWLTVTAFSRPAGAAARLGGPLVRVFQRAYARRCGAVLRRLARSTRF